MINCCEKFETSTKKRPPKHELGCGSEQPYREQPHIEDKYGSWNINGCCGYCWVVKSISFCPWCGEKLPEAKQ